MGEQGRHSAATQPCGGKYFERTALFRAEVTFSRRHGGCVRHRRNRGKTTPVRAGQVNEVRGVVSCYDIPTYLSRASATVAEPTQADRVPRKLGVVIFRVAKISFGESVTPAAVNCAACILVIGLHYVAAGRPASLGADAAAAGRVRGQILVAQPRQSQGSDMKNAMEVV